jgi:hydroxypyruvate isomerase
MVFRDLPVQERVRRIADLGFEVEIWDWTTKDLAALASTGATFSSMTGYVEGTLADPDGAAALLRTAEQSLRAAEELDCPRLNVHGTGLDDRGLPVVASPVVTPGMWLTAARTLERLARLGERAGRVFTLENLNTRSTTLACRSPRRRTRWRWSKRSVIRMCGSTSTSTMPRSARGT